MNTNEYNFEQFTEIKGKFSTKISIGKSGIGIGHGFLTKNGLNESKAIKLYFDRSKLAIGFKFMEAHEEGSIKLKIRGKGAHIAVASFFGKYGIEPVEYRGRYEPNTVDTAYGKLYAIQLRTVDK